MKKDNNQPAVISSKKGLIPNKSGIRRLFESGADARTLTLRDIERKLYKIFAPFPYIPTIKVRTKEFNSFYKKYISQLKLGIIVPAITDLMGIRIICPFIDDIVLVEDIVKKHFDVIEVERKGQYTFKEFGYESTHLLIKIPADIARVRGETGSDVVEMQVRTILQDAWAEVEHEIFYKTEFTPVDIPMKRKLAAVNASLSLADIVFQEIRNYQKKLNDQMEQRRKTFYQKIEESTDDQLFVDMPVQQLPEKPAEEAPAAVSFAPNASIDDMLLDALEAHNENRFEVAITVYSKILKLKPDKTILSLIYKHRGMAYFAQSRYHEAIEDFSDALDLDDQSYRVAYYRGVVHSVLKEYLEAIDDFTLSLKVHPYQAFCLLRRGQAYYHIGDYPKALSDCEEAYTMAPEKDAIVKFRSLIQNKLKM